MQVEFNIDIINLIIALLALLAAFYAICYTHHFNRRKIVISNSYSYKHPESPPIIWFEIVNVSPVPVTIKNIEFIDNSGYVLNPLQNYEPEITYSSTGGFFDIETPDLISPNRYADMLDGSLVLQPYTSEEFGYYFESVKDTLTIRVTCLEIIHRFKRSQSFLCNLPEIQD